MYRHAEEKRSCQTCVNSSYLAPDQCARKSSSQAHNRPCDMTTGKKSARGAGQECDHANCQGHEIAIHGSDLKGNGNPCRDGSRQAEENAAEAA